MQILHLPGHTAGSLGLLDRAAGVLATGDTLYATDEELIDWYPGGSSVTRMGQSVKMLMDLVAGSKEADFTALPGHNQVLRRIRLLRKIII